MKTGRQNPARDFLSQEQRQKVLALYAQGLSKTVLAQRFGCSQDMILKLVRQEQANALHTPVCGASEGTPCEERGLRGERPQACTARDREFKADGDAGDSGLPGRPESPPSPS